MNIKPNNEMHSKENNEILKVFFEAKEKLLDPKNVEENNQRAIKETKIKKLFLSKIRKEGFYRKERAIVRFLLIFALGLPLSVAVLAAFVISKQNFSLIVLLLIPVISLLSITNYFIDILFDICEMQIQNSLSAYDYSKVHELL